MKNISRRRAWTTKTAAAISLAAFGAATPLYAGIPQLAPASIRATAQQPTFVFAHDFILGTSMDLHIDGNDAQAHAAHAAILAEIDRLASILSTRDPNSQVSILRTTGGATHPELAQLLDLYANWSRQTGGLISAFAQPMIDVWKHAACVDRLPETTELSQALALSQSASLSCLNIDALGKAFIIEKAVAIARQLAPAGLLNIGGDLCAWGDVAWPVAIADPDHPADNAAPLAVLDLRNAALAGSGGYRRFVTIAGQRYSHLIDPRSAHALAPKQSASVLAADCVTANALSTSGSILGPTHAAPLLQRSGAKGWFITTGNGQSSAGGTLTHAARPVALAAAQQPNWPKGFQVSIDIEIKRNMGGRKYRRPYVAVWIEDKTGKAVRTITIWGNESKYMRDMTSWCRASNSDRNLFRAVCAATRNPGKYTVTWDGLDDKGKPVDKGDYVIVMEINREHGGHSTERVTLACKDTKQSASFKATNESEQSAVEFGPRK